jgi:hypothetical protein
LECYTDIETDTLLHKYGPTSIQMIHLVSKLGSGVATYSADEVIFTDDVIDHSMSTHIEPIDTQEGSLAGIMSVSDPDWFDSI